MIVHAFNSSIVSGPEMLVLPALKKLKEEVSVVFLTEMRLWKESQRPIEYAKSLGHTVYSVPVRSRWDAQAFQEFRNILDKLQPQITHAHDVKASLYLYQAKCLREGFPGLIVSTHHGASYRKGKIRLYEEYYVRRLLPSFDLVLTVCERDRSSVVQRGVDSSNVFTHLNGANRLQVLSHEREGRKKTVRDLWKYREPSLQTCDSAYFLGVVARLSKEKRHDRMLRVIEKLNSSVTLSRPVVLLCFGSGPEEARLKELTKKLKIENFVFWMGYSSTISDEMAGFDLLLCLSDGEGIPINLVEAGWAATPVFATRVGGIPDLIPNKEFGFLVDREWSDGFIAEKMSLVLQDAQLRAQVGRNFQNRVVSRFSQDSWLKQLESAYAAMRSSSVSESVVELDKPRSSCA